MAGLPREARRWSIHYRSPPRRATRSPWASPQVGKPLGNPGGSTLAPHALQVGHPPHAARPSAQERGNLFSGAPRGAHHRRRAFHWCFVAVPGGATLRGSICLASWCVQSAGIRTNVENDMMTACCSSSGDSRDMYMSGCAAHGRRAIPNKCMFRLGSTHPLGRPGCVRTLQGDLHAGIEHQKEPGIPRERSGKSWGDPGEANERATSIAQVRADLGKLRDRPCTRVTKAARFSC